LVKVILNKIDLSFKQEGEINKHINVKLIYKINFIFLRSKIVILFSPFLIEHITFNNVMNNSQILTYQNSIKYYHNNTTEIAYLVQFIKLIFWYQDN